MIITDFERIPADKNPQKSVKNPYKSKKQMALKLPKIKRLSWQAIHKEYKFMINTGVVALVLIGIVFVVVKNEIDRFTFIMPIFASWILACILFDLPDEAENEN